MTSMLCADCELPFLGSDIPVVLEWGKSRHPLIMGRPPLKAIHINCDLKRKGKAPRLMAEPSAPAPVTSKAVTGTKPPSNKPAKEPVAKAPAHNVAGKFIFKLVKDNPRKPDTWGWKSFNLVKDGMAVEDYLKAGGRKNDLAWDIDHKFVELRDTANVTAEPTPTKPTTTKKTASKEKVKEGKRK